MSREMKHLSDIKNPRASGLRCKPRMRDQEYLNLYLLEKKRELLKRYKKATDRANLQIENNIGEINTEIKKIKGSIAQKVQANRDKEETKRKEAKSKPQTDNSKLKNQVWGY